LALPSVDSPHSLLILGGEGQIGSALAALDWPGWTVTALDRREGDITAASTAQAILRRRPRVVVNAAAYTDVEGAEADPAAALRVNARAPRQLAEACAAAGAWLIHYSTDYVFDGAKPGAYVESDAPGPLNVYGASKLAGEQAIVASACRHLILRTSWVYSGQGSNFTTKILARARLGQALRVVDDQFGAPTWAHALALATQRAIGMLDRTQAAGPALSGIYHLSAAGRCNWYEVAKAALELSGLTVPVTPVAAAMFGAVARRPANSVLDSSRFAATFGCRIAPWREDLARCLAGADQSRSNP